MPMHKQRLPERMVICPEDRIRVQWQEASYNAAADQGAAYFAISERPNYPAADNVNKRWPYSSSYQLVPCGYSPDRLVNTPSGPILTVSQSSMGHRWYIVGNSRTILGSRRYTDVDLPSGKVHMFDANQRHAPKRCCWWRWCALWWLRAGRSETSCSRRYGSCRRV